MLVDFRYHIGSLVAVFIALGIGILVGHGLLGSEGFVAEQQRLLVDELETRFARMQEERSRLEGLIKNLEGELAQAGEFNRRVLPLAVADRLKGRSLLLVVTGRGLAKDDIHGAVDILELAGAQVGVLEVVNPRGEWVPELMAWLGEGGRALPGINILKELPEGIDSVVLLGGGGEDRTGEIDLPFLQSYTGRVIGAETSKALCSYMGVYQGEGIATVDNIDTPAGQLGLVLLLADEKIDHLGIKETARRLLPEGGP
ncbi:MAG: copper transporter [Limnochordia bacterium]|jgi:hypothetical protein